VPSESRVAGTSSVFLFDEELDRSAVDSGRDVLCGRIETLEVLDQRLPGGGTLQQFVQDEREIPCVPHKEIGRQVRRLRCARLGPRTKRPVTEYGDVSKQVSNLGQLRMQVRISSLRQNGLLE